MTYVFLGPRTLSDCILGIHRNFHSAAWNNMPIQNNPDTGPWRQCRKHELYMWWSHQQVWLCRIARPSTVKVSPGRMNGWMDLSVWVTPWFCHSLFRFLPTLRMPAKIISRKWFLPLQNQSRVARRPGQTSTLETRKAGLSASLGHSQEWPVWLRVINFPGPL